MKRASLSENRAAGQYRTQDIWAYSFNLLIRERRAVGVTFDEIDLALYQPGTNPWTARYSGQWRLEASDEFRLPLVSSLSCLLRRRRLHRLERADPLWRITLHGTDDRGQAVKAVIDLSLPAAPHAVPAATSASVRAISLPSTRSR